MRARHTQVRPQCRAITSKALVNRARMKVVKMKLTKFLFVIPGCVLRLAIADRQGAGPESILTMVVMDSGFARSATKLTSQLCR